MGRHVAVYTKRDIRRLWSELRSGTFVVISGDRSVYKLVLNKGERSLKIRALDMNVEMINIVTKESTTHNFVEFFFTYDPQKDKYCRKYLETTDIAADNYMRRYVFADKLVNRMCIGDFLIKLDDSSRWAIKEISYPNGSILLGLESEKGDCETIDAVYNFFNMGEVGEEVTYYYEPEALSEPSEGEYVPVRMNIEPLDSTVVVIGGLYRHFKGGLYVVECIATKEECREEKLVVYKSVSTGEIWARDYEVFIEYGEEIHNREDNIGKQWRRFEYMGKVK